jgi:hypothetical protein
MKGLHLETEKVLTEEETKITHVLQNMNYIGDRLEEIGVPMELFAENLATLVKYLRENKDVALKYEIPN